MCLVAAPSGTTMFTRFNYRVKVGRHKSYRWAVENLSAHRLAAYCLGKRDAWRTNPLAQRGSFWLEEDVGFVFGGGQALGKSAAVVLRHAVFPLEKISNALRLDAHLDAAQAGEKEVHFVAVSGRAAQVLG